MGLSDVKQLNILIVRAGHKISHVGLKVQGVDLIPILFIGLENELVLQFEKLNFARLFSRQKQVSVLS